MLVLGQGVGTSSTTSYITGVENTKTSSIIVELRCAIVFRVSIMLYLTLNIFYTIINMK